jgi:hypothetical protein
MVIGRSEPCDPHPCKEIYTYTWDEVGRLATAKRAFKKNLRTLPITVASVAYAYNGGGIRVLKSVTDLNDKIFDTLLGARGHGGPGGLAPVPRHNAPMSFHRCRALRSSSD